LRDWQKRISIGKPIGQTDCDACFFLGGLVLIVGGFALLWFGVEPDGR
jgi:hypothetical protein